MAILYENTVVFAIVYRCRFHGERLDAAAIRANPLQGDLIVHRRGMGRIAKLVAEDGETYLTPILDKVRLLDLNERGLLIAGRERYPGRNDKRDGPTYPQAWWCVPTRRPVPTPDMRPQQLREATEIGRTMVNHYSRRRG